MDRHSAKFDNVRERRAARAEALKEAEKVEKKPAKKKKASKKESDDG